MAFFTLHLTSNESEFNYLYENYEFGDKKFELGLLKISGDIEISKTVTINQTNNKFCYIIDGFDMKNELVFEEITVDIPNGKYDFDGLIKKIKDLLCTKDKKFFQAKLENDSVVFDIKDAYSIDFTKEKNKSDCGTDLLLHKIFGFSNEVLKSGKHKSENKFNFETFENIFIVCPSINDSYVNTKKISTIFRVFKADGEIDIEPSNIIYHKVIGRKLEKLKIELVDINNNLIEFKYINLYIDLHLKEITR